MAQNFASYQVGLKIMLKKGDECLFLTDTITGKIDLPGGRINDDEYEIPLASIIKREVSEELGNDLEYELGESVFQYRARVSGNGPYVFIIVYEASYLAGSVRLSPEHSTFRWVDKNKIELSRGEFFNNEAYLAFKKYFGLASN